MCFSLGHFLVCKGLSYITYVLLKQKEQLEKRRLRQTYRQKGSEPVHLSLQGIVKCRGLKLTYSTYSWETKDSSVDQLGLKESWWLGQPSFYCMTISDLQSIFSTVSFTWGQFSLISFPAFSSSILISFDISFSPGRMFTHLIMSQCLLPKRSRQPKRSIQKIQESTCMHPPASPQLDASTAAGLQRAWDETVLYGTEWWDMPACIYQI